MNNFFIESLNNQLSKTVISISSIDEITNGITQADTFRVWVNTCRMFAGYALKSKDFSQALHHLYAAQYFMNKLDTGYSITEFDSAYKHVVKLAIYYLNNDAYNTISHNITAYPNSQNIQDTYKDCKIFDEIIEYFSMDASTDITLYANFKKYRKDVCEKYLKYLLANRWVNYISKDQYLQEKLYWQEIANYGELNLDDIQAISSAEVINIKMLEEKNIYN